MEVPQVMDVELIREVPRPQTQQVQKPISKVAIQLREEFVDVPVPIRQERPVEVPEVQYVELLTEVMEPQTEFREKPVDWKMLRLAPRRDQLLAPLMAAQQDAKL